MTDDPSRSEKINKLLRSQPFAVLATKGEYPHTSLVSFWSSENNASVVFITSRKTRKYRNIMQDARAALMLDDRTNKPSADLKEGSSVMLTGAVREAVGKEAETLRQVFLERNPDQFRFAEDADTAIMVMTVEGMDLVTSFQD